MAEFVLRSANYQAIEVDPGAAKAIGEYEVFGETAGFYLTSVTTAEAGDAAFRSALIVRAEQVLVEKVSAEVWVAGDAIYWNGTAATNVIGAIRRIGVAKEAAANPSATSIINFEGLDPQGVVPA